MGIKEPARIGTVERTRFVIFAAQDRGHLARRVVDFRQQLLAGMSLARSSRRTRHRRSRTLQSPQLQTRDVDSRT